jgi:hypothetical protein
VAVGNGGRSALPWRRSAARRYPRPCRAEGGASRPSARMSDATGVVNDAVEDGVGERGDPDQVMPTDAIGTRSPRRRG